MMRGLKDKMDKELLFQKAKEAYKNNYAIFSKFGVSAAVYLKNGDIFTGVNIENSSYPLTICAERCALFKVYSEGYRKDDIIALCIYHEGNEVMPYPCGACRQVMSDLMNHDSFVYIINDKDMEAHTVDELLPFSFTPESLK